MLDLRLEHIGKTFPPSRRILEGISLTVSRGECLALVGPSGCGKTTLLRIIAGLELVTAGDIHIGGRSVSHVASHRRNIAMLFQRPALVPNQTVRQNLRWAWSLREPWAFLQRGADPREIDLVRIARLLDLDRDLDRPVQQLSGGQQQRVALGRCLLRRASIWLLDEPLGHLDAPLKTDLRRQIRMLARNFGITMVHVTHDPDEAFAVGDRVAVMQEGQIVQVDEPRQLQRFPQNRFVAELVHHQQGGLNVWAGQFCRQGEEAFFQGAFGRWPIPKRIAAVLLEKFRQDKNFPPEGGNLNIILGIAASEVRCHADHDGNGDEIRQTLPVLQRECSAVGTWLIAGDARGRWVGRSAGFERGNEVMMAFSMERAYWFDGVTGQTLSARAG